MPSMGLELATLSSRVTCSPDRARQAPVFLSNMPFLEQFLAHSKIWGRLETSRRAPAPHSVPHHGGTFVGIGVPARMRRHHPESIAGLGAHAQVCPSGGSGPVRRIPRGGFTALQCWSSCLFLAGVSLFIIASVHEFFSSFMLPNWFILVFRKFIASVYKFVVRHLGEFSKRPRTLSVGGFICISQASPASNCQFAYVLPTVRTFWIILCLRMDLFPL